MSVVVATNVESLNAQRHLARTQVSLQVAMARLASGLRINSAADDAAGLAISEKLKSQIRGFGQAKRNAADGVSLIQTADGALSELSGILIRMRELSVQAANGVLTAGDRQNVHAEFDALRQEIDRIANVIEFNGTKLLDGSIAAGITFQVGLKNTVNDKITVSVADTRAAQLGDVAASLRVSVQSLSTLTKAQRALGVLETAIAQVVDRQARLGATMNRLATTMNALATMGENLSAANSRIRDADIAQESAEMTKNQILMNAGVAVLAQANQLPGLALSLLGGR